MDSDEEIFENQKLLIDSILKLIDAAFHLTEKEIVEKICVSLEDNNEYLAMNLAILESTMFYRNLMHQKFNNITKVYNN